jgi:hypothetical protein
VANASPQGRPGRRRERREHPGQRVHAVSGGPLPTADLQLLALPHHLGLPAAGRPGNSLCQTAGAGHANQRPVHLGVRSNGIGLSWHAPPYERVKSTPLGNSRYALM